MMLNPSGTAPRWIEIAGGPRFLLEISYVVGSNFGSLVEMLFVMD